jgi:hypothetical protein
VDIVADLRTPAHSTDPQYAGEGLLMHEGSKTLAVSSLNFHSKNSVKQP